MNSLQIEYWRMKNLLDKIRADHEELVASYQDGEDKALISLADGEPIPKLGKLPASTK